MLLLKTIPKKNPEDAVYFALKHNYREFETWKDLVAYMHTYAQSIESYTIYDCEKIDPSNDMKLNASPGDGRVSLNSNNSKAIFE